VKLSLGGRFKKGVSDFYLFFLRKLAIILGVQKRQVIGWVIFKPRHIGVFFIYWREER